MTTYEQLVVVLYSTRKIGHRGVFCYLYLGIRDLLPALLSQGSLLLDQGVETAEKNPDPAHCL